MKRSAANSISQGGRLFATDHQIDTSPSSDAEPTDWSFLDPPRSGGEIGWLQHYQVLGELGAGAMGAVFCAVDSQLKRLVALKVMHPRLAMNSVARQRFLREAQAMAAIHHEHVVSIYQVGMAENSAGKRVAPFLAMQYLEGETLHGRFMRHGQLGIMEVSRIGREIAEGLSAAHAKALVHRDIKPSNIWLAAPSSRVKILDFGLARPLAGGSNLSEPGQILGTPYFMSPEQACGEPVDPRSDLFSLGSLLYALLSGTLPFDAPTPVEVLTGVVKWDPVPLLEKNSDIPPELANLVHRLMAKSPADRPATAEAVAADLARIEDDCADVGFVGASSTERTKSRRTSTHAFVEQEPVDTLAGDQHVSNTLTLTLTDGEERRERSVFAGLLTLLAASAIILSGSIWIMLQLVR